MLAVPTGRQAEEPWFLAAGKERVHGPEDLDGWQLVSLAGHSESFVRGPALGDWGELPSTLTITFSGAVLSSLRKAARGEKIVVLLDAEQAEALDRLPFAGDLEIVHTSPPLPVSVVCSIGDRVSPEKKWRNSCRRWMDSLRDRMPPKRWPGFDWNDSNPQTSRRWKLSKPPSAESPSDPSGAAKNLLHCGPVRARGVHIRPQRAAAGGRDSARRVFSGASKTSDFDEILARADIEFGKMPDMAAVERAQELYLDAARVEDAPVEAFLGAARATAWLIEHTDDGARRKELAVQGVQIGQWCRRLAPLGSRMHLSSGPRGGTTGP